MQLAAGVTAGAVAAGFTKALVARVATTVADSLAPQNAMQQQPPSPQTSLNIGLNGAVPGMGNNVSTPRPSISMKK